MEITISDNLLKQAASGGCDEFLAAIVGAMKTAVGSDELTAEAMSQLDASQTTLWGYLIFRDEVMDGGFVQLIYNGYGPFFFANPFAKVMKLWGLRDFSKLVYKAKKVYEANKEELTRERTDEEFMALFEQYPKFDDLDDEFVENEEEITESVARYVDENLQLFVQVKQD